VYYSPSNNFAHSQISDMLVKESGFDSQSVWGMLLLSGNVCTLHQHPNPTYNTIFEALDGITVSTILYYWK
jgi:hypothetical protein